MKRFFLQCKITLFILIICFLCCITGLKKIASAKIEWSLLKKVTLDDSPKDIVMSSDGTTAFILCSKNILVYSINENKVNDTIPITGKFSQIALSNDGGRLFLTDTESKELSIIQITEIYDFQVDHSPVIGKLDAPVTVVAFLDFQCPYCAKVYPVLEQLLEKYPAEVNLVIKHNPLRMHRFAENASIAALAASKQKKYQEITKVFFENYKTLNDNTIKKYVEEAGLDMKAFDKDYSDPSLKKVVRQDLNLGIKSKVRGVPALFINGRRVKNRSLGALSYMVEKELSKGK